MYNYKNEIWKRNIGGCLQFSSTNEMTSDVIIHCKDGTISTHQLVLASVSSMMYKILKTISSEEKLTILMPDFNILSVEEYFLSHNEKIDNKLKNLKKKVELKDFKEECVSDYEFPIIETKEIVNGSKYDDEESIPSSDRDFDPDFDLGDLSPEKEDFKEEVPDSDTVVIPLNKPKEEPESEKTHKKLFKEKLARYHFTEQPNKASVKCKHCGKKIKYQIKNYEKLVKRHLLVKHLENFTEDQKKDLLHYCKIDVDDISDSKKNKLIDSKKKLKKRKKPGKTLDPQTGEMVNVSKVNVGNRSALVWNYVFFDSETGSSKCKSCDKTFHNSHRSVILRHLVKFHNIVEKEEGLRMQLMCSYCGKLYGTSSQRKACEINHQNKQNIPKLICPVQGCGKEFDNQFKFERHKNVHRTISCQYCGKTFVKTSGLYVHLRTHEDYVPYECEVCFKTFKFYNGLKRHLKNQHPDFLALMKDRKFECSQCNKCFTSKVFLQRHIENKHKEYKSLC